MTPFQKVICVSLLALAVAMPAWAQQPATVARHAFLPPHALQHVYEQLRHTILEAFGPEGDGTLEEQHLQAPPLPHVDPATGRVEERDPNLDLSGPGGRGGR